MVDDVTWQKPSADDDGGKAKTRARRRYGRVIAVVLAVFVCAFAIGMEWLETSYARTCDGLATARNSAIALETRDHDALFIEDSALADPATNGAVRLAYDDLEAVLAEESLEVSGVSSLNPVKLWQAIETNRQTAFDVRQAEIAFHDAVSAQTVSWYAHVRDVAKDALADSIVPARDEVSATEGQVHDDSLRQAVSSLADKAEALSNVTLSTPTLYDDTSAELKQAVDALETDNVQWKREAEEAARREAAARAARASRTSSNASSGVSDTWYANYRGTDNDSTANSDGSLSQWRDDYYIAHSWSSNGKEIASKPGHIVINGKSYHYVSSMTSSVGADAGSALAFARQNGGIGFQTCTGDGGVVITHYEPD